MDYCFDNYRLYSSIMLHNFWRVCFLRAIIYDFSSKVKDYAVCLHGIIGFPGSGIQCRISHNLSKSAKIGSNTARLEVLKRRKFFNFLRFSFLLPVTRWFADRLNQELYCKNWFDMFFRQIRFFRETSNLLA